MDNFKHPHTYSNLISLYFIMEHLITGNRMDEMTPPKALIGRRCGTLRRFYQRCLLGDGPLPHASHDLVFQNSNGEHTGMNPD